VFFLYKHQKKKEKKLGVCLCVCLFFFLGGGGGVQSYFMSKTVVHTVATVLSMVKHCAV